MSAKLNPSFLRLARAHQALGKHRGDALPLLSLLEQVRDTAQATLKEHGIEVRDDFADVPDLLRKLTEQVEALTLLQDAVTVHQEIVKAAAGAPSVQYEDEYGFDPNESSDEEDGFDPNEFHEPDLPPVPKHRRW